MSRVLCKHRERPGECPDCNELQSLNGHEPTTRPTPDTSYDEDAGSYPDDEQ